jgi:hypothetical protein
MTSLENTDEIPPAIKEWLETTVRPLAEEVLKGNRPRIEAGSKEADEAFWKAWDEQKAPKTALNESQESG